MQFSAPRFWVALLAVFLLVGVFVPALAGFLTDWWWFDTIGQRALFATRVTAQVLLFTVQAALLFALVAGNAWWAIRTTEHRAVRMNVGEAGHTLPMLAVSALVSVAGGIVAARAWPVWLAWWHHGAFGVPEPILGRDAAFYVFTLPVLEHVRQALLVGMVLAALVSGGLYVLRGAVQLQFAEVDGQYMIQSMRVGPQPRRHVSLLMAAVLLVLAFHTWLARYALMHDQIGLVAGPGYADIYGTLPALALLSLVLTAAGGMAGWGMPARWPVGAVVLGLAAYFAYPFGLQQVSVLPNELIREAPYIENHIAATRRAFELDGVEEASLTGDAELGPEDIENNRLTIENVRLWDHEPLLATFAQVQEIRTYYEFVSVDNDRYVLDGELRQIMLSPRELELVGLPDRARTWVNETMTYTHGYGLALGPVNRVTEQGLPHLFIKDLPPRETIDVKIDRPEIYYGEAVASEVMVNTGVLEFDYPSGEEQVYTDGYKGLGGVEVGGLVGKAVFSVRLGLELLLSDDVRPDSRALLYRHLRTRVHHIAPFLAYDTDPYMVLVGGRLLWVLDAYTHTTRFPYAEATGATKTGPNYLRNSVKVVVDAYDGTTTFYRVDDQDPIVEAWSRAFPGLFTPGDDMDPELRAHMRYPQDLFREQAGLFGTYHMTEPQVFYNREDEWEVPSLPAEPETEYGQLATDERRRVDLLQGPNRPWGIAAWQRGHQAVPVEKPTLGQQLTEQQRADLSEKPHQKRMSPYYTVMKLPDGDQEEYIVMLPFNPRNKPNLAAWMVARMDGEHYGKLRVYRFPKDKMVYGPNMIVARINQDDRISEKLSLWNQQGSQVLLGTLLVIPIEESLIYVQPLYLTADSGSIPELKRVIVGYENTIAMEPTLEEALAQIFGRTEPPPPPPAAPQPTTESDDWTQLTEKARTQWMTATEAAKTGDWATYGAEIEALGATLERLRTLER